MKIHSTTPANNNAVVRRSSLGAEGTGKDGVDICTDDDLKATRWGAKLKELREMVSKEDSVSMRITPEKIERNQQVSQLFFDLGIELDELLNRQGPPSGANWASSSPRARWWSSWSICSTRRKRSSSAIRHRVPAVF